MVRLGMMLMLMASSVAFAADKPRDPEQFFFNESFGDFSEELQTARDGGKKGILIMFEMDECPFCHRMKTTILNQPDVQAYFRENFLIFPVDIEGDVEITDFQGNATTMKDFAFKQYRVRATPVFAFYDLDGNYIKRARFTGATRDKEEFMLLGQYVVDGAYKDQTFTRYKRSAR
ncbi:thioredoxin family protein [Thiosocius teredinicola]|uniref:thioredoxin family protein n=1 Tax=Thiosocius teredinicola TaxID=1973002 RepID=UPI0038CDA503